MGCYLSCVSNSIWTLRKPLHISEEMISLCKVIILWSECQKTPTHLHFLTLTQPSNVMMYQFCVWRLKFLKRQHISLIIDTELLYNRSIMVWHCDLSTLFQYISLCSSLLFKWAPVLRYEPWSHAVTWARGTRWLRSLPRLCSLSVGTHTAFQQAVWLWPCAQQ